MEITGSCSKEFYVDAAYALDCNWTWSRNPNGSEYLGTLFEILCRVNQGSVLTSGVRFNLHSLLKDTDIPKLSLSLSTPITYTPALKIYRAIQTINWESTQRPFLMAHYCRDFKAVAEKYSVRTFQTRYS